MPDPELICRNCGKPVSRYRADFDVFEQMHWLCFHLQFEHEGDPDDPCGDPSCPHWHIQVFREKLVRLGEDPDKVIETAIAQRWNL